MKQKTVAGKVPKNFADELVVAMREAVAIARGEVQPAKVHNSLWPRKSKSA